MSRTAPWAKPRQVAPARDQRPIARYLVGAVALTALYLVGHGLLPQQTQQRTIPAMRAGQPVLYRAVPALLARARAHDPLLRLPHARWYLRVRHGHAQVIVIDHAPLRAGGDSAIDAGGGR